MNDKELKQLINSKREIRVGDKVRLLSGAERGCLHGFVNGEVYTVDKVEKTTPPVRVKRSDGFTGWAYIKQLEVLT